MITGIKINNIRNLDFDDYLQLAPMTILLGKNSSGKSTFLRTFPLIKQTLEIRRSTPLLWYGNLVDFGSFDDTINKFSEESNKTIKISFKIKDEVPSRFLTLKRKESTTSEKKIVETSVEISIMKKIDNEYISKIEILRENLNFILNLNEKQELDSIKLNDTVIDNLKLKYNILFQELIPTEFHTKNSEKELYFEKEYIQEKIFKNFVEVFELDNEETRKIIQKKLSEVGIERFRGFNDESDISYVRFPKINTLLYFDKNIAFNTDEDFIKKIKKIIPKHLNKINFSEDKIKKLKNLCLMLEIVEMLQYINIEISNYFKNTSYIAPLRATAQRYYRIQGLDIESIDPTGSNLPIYLKNLSLANQLEFSKWTEENFGFKLTFITNPGHVSLAIQQYNKSFNLADTGFGFSQILPILLQIWSRIFNNDKVIRRRLPWLENNNLVFLIEQPELHLHPAMQATLIDVFIKAIKLGKKKKINIKFVLETHSETIINRIGRHIIEENLESENVEIMIFENEKDKLEIIKTNITPDGIIEKWPLGFFEPKELLK